MDPRKLRNELEALRGRLRALWVCYGTLRLLAVGAALLALTYVLDRNLSLPRGVRLVLLAVMIGVTVFLLLRGVLYPLRRRLDARDVACAVEERFPEFDGRLVSTLELEGEAIDKRRNVSLEMVERLRQETGSIRETVRLERIFDYTHLRRVAAVAAALVALVVGFGIVRPELSAIFAHRLFGGDARWPRFTQLEVVFPERADYFTVEESDGRPSLVRIARGASLPVTVRSSGKRPDFVELRAEAAAGRLPNAATTGSGPDEWVGRFRAVRESFRFWPTGGDDDGFGREVEVAVLEPPEVSQISTSIRFPAYTGLAPRTQDRGDVEAPVGSTVEVRVSVAAAVTSGELSFDGGKDAIALAPVAATPGSWAASFQVTESRAYAIHLLGDHGFRNLEPANYSVIALRDRPPTVRLLEPARADTDLTPQGLLAVRVAADDDYGVSALGLSMVPFGGEQVHDFDLLAAEAPGADIRRHLVYAQLELNKIPFAHADMTRPPQVGDAYVYKVVARDNLADAAGTALPNETAVTERRVDIVSNNEKLRLLTERQIRMKEDVRATRDLQQEKRERLQEVLTEFEASEGDVAPNVDELAALEIGQTQVTSRATRLCRGFADVFEEYLLNRIDTSAAAERLIPMLLERKRASSVIDDFDFEVYRPLVDGWRSGAFGDLDLVGRMLAMLATVLDTAGKLSPDAGGAINEARLMLESNDRPASIKRALAKQDEVLKQLDELLEKLDEWEDYQGLVSEFRELLDGQRSLFERTRSTLKDPAGDKR